MSDVAMPQIAFLAAPVDEDRHPTGQADSSLFQRKRPGKDELPRGPGPSYVGPVKRAGCQVEADGRLVAGQRVDAGQDASWRQLEGVHPRVDPVEVLRHLLEGGVIACLAHDRSQRMGGRQRSRQLLFDAPRRAVRGLERGSSSLGPLEPRRERQHLSASSVKGRKSDDGEDRRSSRSPGVGQQTPHTGSRDQQAPILGRDAPGGKDFRGRSRWSGLSLTDPPRRSPCPNRTVILSPCHRCRSSAGTS